MIISFFKHTSAGLLGLVFLLSVAGCGMVDRIQNTSTASNTANSNKTLTDKAVDLTVGESKIGVPECDEVMDMIAAQANNPDDGYFTKGAKTAVLNRVKEEIKSAAARNNNDPAELARFCSQFKTQLESINSNRNTNSQ